MDVKTIKKIQTSMGVAVGVVFSQELTRLGKAWLVFPGSYAVISLIIISISVLLLNYLGSELFSHWRWLRKKLLGRQYIEGVWFDIMRCDGELLDVGISCMSYDDFNLTYRGQDYNLRTDLWAPFHARMLRLEWPRLTYIYSAQRQGEASAEMLGYGVLDFHVGAKGAPRTHSGQYFPFHAGKTICFESFRLNADKDAELLARLDEPETRKQALITLYNRYSRTPLGETPRSN